MQELNLQNKIMFAWPVSNKKNVVIWAVSKNMHSSWSEMSPHFLSFPP